MKRSLAIGNVIALIITIVINYLSNTGFFNGETIAALSARYPTLFTPASYAFSIWGLIYVGMLYFTLYQGFAKMPDQERYVSRIGGWFILSCLANSGWVLAWLYDHTGLSVLIMLLLAFSLWMIILRTDMELTDPPLRTIASVWWPFCLYAGWVSIAFFVNLSAWLTKIRWPPFTTAPVAWAIGMTVLAGILHFTLTWTRNLRELAFVGVWALIAIAVADWDRAPAVAWTALVVSAILFISSSIHGYRHREFNPWRKRIIPTPHPGK